MLHVLIQHNFILFFYKVYNRYKNLSRKKVFDVYRIVKVLPD